MHTVNPEIGLSDYQLGTPYWFNIRSFSQSWPNLDKSLIAVGRKLPTRRFNASAFAIPATRVERDAGRNTRERPGHDNLGTSLFKTLPQHENANVPLGSEFIDTFRQAQFGNADR